MELGFLLLLSFRIGLKYCSLQFEMENTMSGSEVVFQSDDFKPNNPPPINLYNQTGGRTRRIVFYSLALALLLVVSWFLFREFSYVYSLRATVMGDLVNYKSPDMGHI